MTVYAWGYGDVLENILRGIAWLFDPSGGLMVMLGKITILIGFIAVLLSYFGDYGQRDPLRILKFYVLAIGVWTLFMQVKTTVQIDDIQDNQSRVVQNVPYAIAYPLAFTSQVQKAVAQTLDQVFGLPDDCGYSKTGMLGCVGVVNSALSMRITDPYLYQSFNQFITNCVYTNILDGTYNLEDLQTSQNLLTYMGSSLHPARFTKVYADAECQWTDSGCSPCKAGCSMDCPSAYNYLINQLYNYANYQALNALAYATGMTTSAVSQALNTAPPYLLNVSQTGQSLLLQSIAMNHLGEAYLRWAEANLAPGVGYAVGVAQRQVEAQGISSYFVAGKYLPVLRGILIVLLAGFTSALFILLLTPMAVRALTGYMILFLWTILWSVGDALLNAIIHVKLHGATSFSSLGQGGLTLMTLPVVQQSAMDYISMAGQFYWMIPTLALLASTGFSIYAMNSLSGAVSSPAQSGTASASSQVAQGNLGGGNVSWNNQSFGNTSWGGMSWGSLSMGTTSGMTTTWNRQSVGFIDTKGGIVSMHGGQLDMPMATAFMGKALAGGDRKGAEALGYAMALMQRTGQPLTNVEMLTDRQGNLVKLSGSAGNQKIEFDARAGYLKIDAGGEGNNRTQLMLSWNEGKGTFMAGAGVDTSKGDISALINRAREISSSVSLTKSQAEALNKAWQEFKEKRDLESFMKFMRAAEVTGMLNEISKAFSGSKGFDFRLALERAIKEQTDKGETWKKATSAEAQKMSNGGFEIGLGGGLGTGGLKPGVKLGVGYKKAWLSQDGRKVVVQGENNDYYVLSLGDSLARNFAYAFKTQDSVGDSTKWIGGKQTEKGYGNQEGTQKTEGASFQEVFSQVEQVIKSKTENVSDSAREMAQVSQSLLPHYFNARKEAYMKEGKNEGEATLLALEDTQRITNDLLSMDKTKQRNALDEISNSLGIGGLSSSQVSQIEQKAKEAEVVYLENINPSTKGEWLKKDVEDKLKKPVPHPNYPTFSVPKNVRLELNNYKQWQDYNLRYELPELNQKYNEKLNKFQNKPPAVSEQEKYALNTIRTDLNSNFLQKTLKDGVKSAYIRERINEDLQREQERLNKLIE